MDLLETILKNEKYKKIVDSFSRETLEIIARDHERALAEARKGIQKEEPEKLDNIGYLEELASGMQKLASEFLNKSKSN